MDHHTCLGRCIEVSPKSKAIGKLDREEVSGERVLYRVPADIISCPRWGGLLSLLLASVHDSMHSHSKVC